MPRLSRGIHRQPARGTPTRKLLLLLATVLALAGCVPAAMSPSTAGAALKAEEDGVVAVAEDLFTAMEARDTNALAELFLPQGRVASLRTGGPQPPSPQIRTAAEFVESFARPGEVIRERIWNPQVDIDGDLASLWAPYELYRGDAISHCGVDTFHFMRVQGEWKILALTYTVQQDGCETDPRR